jgi:hypothetical protein
MGGSGFQYELEPIPEPMTGRAARGGGGRGGQAAGPEVPQEHRLVQPTKYVLEDLPVGTQVTGKAATGETYQGS